MREECCTQEEEPVSFGTRLALVAVYLTSHKRKGR